MPKDILLYGTISQYNAMFFHAQIAEALEENSDEELSLLINSDGGEPGYGMSIIRKVQEMSDQMNIQGETMMHSMALFLLCYVDKDKVKIIDTTQAVLHRAAYSSWYESSTGFTDSVDYEILVKTNKDLEKAFRARVDVEALESLPQFTSKNITLKDIFSMESRIEVLLTASDLKKIGIVGSIVKITPSKVAQIAAQTSAFKKCTSLSEFKMAAQANPNVDEPKNTDMTLEQLKKDFPLVYAAIKAEGHAEGITAGLAQEKERIEGIMAFNEIDPEACKAAIESGKPLSAKQTNELLLKVAGKGLAVSVKKDSAGKVTTEGATDDKTEKEKEVNQFTGELNARLGIGKKEEKAA